MGIPVGAAVCWHDPVEVFGELTAIIGEELLDRNAEYLLHAVKSRAELAEAAEVSTRTSEMRENRSVPTCQSMRRPPMMRTSVPKATHLPLRHVTKRASLRSRGMRDCARCDSDSDGSHRILSGSSAMMRESVDWLGIGSRRLYVADTIRVTSRPVYWDRCSDALVAKIGSWQSGPVTRCWTAWADTHSCSPVLRPRLHGNAAATRRMYYD